MAQKTRKSSTSTSASASRPAAGAAEEKRRFWLTYPPRLITRPLMWELVHRFEVVTNIRQASVTEDIGIVCLEMEGAHSTVKSAVKWLEKQGVRVEPVEINVIES